VLDIFDRILIRLGKKRGVYLETCFDFERKFPYGYSVAQKEPFLKALMRSKNRELPQDMNNLYEMTEIG